MQIPAFDLIGEYHMKLRALEKYFSELAELGQKQDKSEYLEQKIAVRDSLGNLRRFRIEFEALRHKHKDAIAKTLAGARPNIRLTENETILVETIVDMYEGVWANRRERLADA